MIWKKMSKGKILLGLISATSLVATTSLAIVINNNINSSASLINNDVSLIDSQKNADTNEIKPLVPAQANGQNSFLSTSQGPLVYWNNVITSLDWYGAKRWSIDFSEDGYCKISGKYNDSWKRAWFNWDYDRSRNILWVLGYGDKNNQQRLFSIDATNGKTIKIVDTGSYGTLKFISALSSGNVLMWDGATKTYNAQAKLYESNTGAVTGISGNSTSAITSIDGNGTANNSKYKWYFTNTIPIKSGQNLAVLMSFSTVSTTDDNGAANASYNVYFVLVNDNLDLIATSGKWTQGQLVAEGMQGYRNTTISAQKDYYQLVDGTVATVIYNKIIMINPNDVTAPNNVSFSTFTPSESKWILSWSFDTSENLFFKYKDDTKIYKINSNVLKTGSNNSVTAATYYDLSSGNSKMQKYARNFILYNVFGYQGQIMLVNAWYNDYIDIYDSKVPNVSTEADNINEYGLVAAITQNLSDPNSGDSKGLLNTADAFQFSADFSIQPQVLSSKLPSEIVREDLTITNDGFVTQNPKYPTPFTKVMDDEKGILTVTAYIDQIPWFVTDGKMPSDINPTEITKEYTGLNVVSDRISWKDSETDYDFKNTLPSKVTVDDLKRFDPATFNINSQTIVDGSGKILYPNKTYTIENPDDNTGKITIKAKYDYMPLGVDGIDVNVKSVTFSHDYNIFKLTDSKQFVFTGTTSNTTSSIDVNAIPQLSSLLENQIFPSTFASSVSSTNNGYLQFVNTDLSAGYPTSKMNFSFVADDDNGTLKITATLPPDYYSDIKDNTFTQTYTGLNKNRNYSLNWVNNPTNINKLLPSEITDSYIFSNLLTYAGFNPLDLNIQLLPDDENGILNVNITLQGEYNEKVKKSNGFAKYGSTWMTSHTFRGFLTKEQQNNQYKLVFKNDNDATLNELKKKTTQQVYEALKEGGTGLTIGNNTYSNFQDLVSKLLIVSKGVSLPEVSGSDVTVNMYFNNGNGTADFVVKYPESVNSLIFVGSFTGFVLGNDVVTDDVLSFKTQLALETEVKSSKNNQPLYNFFNKTVSEAKEWLLKSDNINNLISYTTGQYSDLLKSNNYSLTITTNEIYGTISAILEFDKNKINNDKSVSMFAFTYSGFKTDTIS